MPTSGLQVEMMDQALTVKDVALLLQVDEKTVYRLTQKGELPGFKVAGSWRFNHRIFGAVKPGRNARPAVRMAALVPPSFCVRMSHSLVVLVSHQSLAGRITSPAASSGTKPCC